MSVIRLLRGFAAAAALSATQQAMAADPLPALNVDLAQTTVSGLSSGAYMAGQFHVAFSTEVVGAGIVAGGPYGCAEGRLELALQRCMATNLGKPDPAALFAEATKLAESGGIDPLTNLADDRVYVFTGTADHTVMPSVGAGIPPFYALAGLPPAAVRLEAGVPAGHGFATESGPVACGTTASPFVNDCDLDQAREILEYLHAPLQPSAATVPVPTPFDQTRYLASPRARGMAETGWVYVPDACRRGEPCRAHILFHGCKQNAESVGEAVTVGAGYNRWAETNRIVVLYPQTHATWSNPNACWDWWGYTGATYATKKGVQMAAVQRMLLALAGQADGADGEACVRHEDWNVTHWQEGRAIACGWGVCAAGSGDPLGTYFGASTVFESPAGFYTAEPCVAR
jgi:poly(3-hydroxybutyrate) depolymerase